MEIHKFNTNALSDDEFVNGEIKYIVNNNQCRLLDRRRTPGYIEKYFKQTAMFRWRITDFEDKGNYWDLPAEDIKLFQILKGSKELEIKDIEIISKKIREFNNLLYIKADKKIKEITNEKIAATERSIFNRFKGNLSNIINKQAINLKF